MEKRFVLCASNNVLTHSAVYMRSYVCVCVAVLFEINDIADVLYDAMKTS